MLCFYELLAGGHRVLARLLGLPQFADAGADGGDPVINLPAAALRAIRSASHG